MCREKRKSLHPTPSKPGRVNLWKSPGHRRSNSLAEEQQEAGRWVGERTGKEEAESLKVKANVNHHSLYQGRGAPPEAGWHSGQKHGPRGQIAEV